MKKITRSPTTWIILSICVIVIVLYFCGFRITYAPDLENSWDAISACASWFGAIMSAGALFVAISIPKIIAEQQNKIALFDKRYVACDSLLFLISVVKQIADGTVKTNKFDYLNTVIETYKSISVVRTIASDCDDVSDIYVRLVFEAGKIVYLFKIKEIETIIEFLKAVDQYVSDVYKGVTADEEYLLTIYNKLNSEKIQEKLEIQMTI